jgi:peptidoglycan/LPS O-acetylase OafA/YrhL
MPTLGHTWSLSIEEQFYVLWPILLWVMLRTGCRRRAIVAATFVAVLAAALHRYMIFRQKRFMNWDEIAANLMRMYMGLDTRADALLIGCGAGLLVAWTLLPQTRRLRIGLTVATPIALAALGYVVLRWDIGHYPLYRNGFTVIAALTALVVVRLTMGRFPLLSPLLESRPLVWVGRISYSLYLVHIPLLRFLAPAGLGWDHPLETVTLAGLSFTAAIALHYLVERPCLRLKDRLRPASETAPAPSPAPPIAEPRSLAA